MYLLNTLKPQKGSKKVSRRLGRGESSGSGKTSGKGGKGQTARTGGTVARHFEGGQMPLYRRIPKLGFISRKKVTGENVFTVLKTSVLDGLLIANPDVVAVNNEILKQWGFRLGRSASAKVKLLFDGPLSRRVELSISRASLAAKAEVERSGGTLNMVG